MACVSSPATANQQRYMNPAATVTPHGYGGTYPMCFTGLGHFGPPILLPDWWSGHSANRQTNKQMPAVA